jgi:hypothetical protein
VPVQFFKNIYLKLKATGPAAIICIVVIGVILLGLYGTGPMATSALGIHSTLGIMLTFLVRQRQVSACAVPPAKA